MALALPALAALAAREVHATALRCGAVLLRAALRAGALRRTIAGSVVRRLEQRVLRARHRHGASAKGAFRRALAYAICFSATNAPGGGAPAFAASKAVAQAGGVGGIVTSHDGAPVAGATVTLRGGAGTRDARTDPDGRFLAANVPAGTYSIRVVALGYDPLAPHTIDVRAFVTTALTLSLARSSSSLTTIGRVRTDGGEALTTSSAPAALLNAQAYAARGYTRVSDVVQDDVSTTLVHRLGGSTLLPTSVALRGPDPTETLVDVDGHRVNNGNTGDFDLSLLDPADYSSIELVKGISPSSLIGPDTIDGAINIRTLEPTRAPHGLMRFSAGSFDSFAETIQATGTFERLGYALSLHRTTSSGEVNQPILDLRTSAPAQVGSAVDGSTGLGKLRYAFGNGGDGYAELSFRDQSVFRDLSAALSSYPAPARAAAGDLPQLSGFEGTALEAHNAAYSLDVRTPLGARDPNGIARASLVLRHYDSLVAQSVVGPGAQTSPYLYDDRDRIVDDTLELERRFSNGTLTVQYDLRNENLETDLLAGVVNDEALSRRTVSPASFAIQPLDAANGPTAGRLRLGQTQRSAALRYVYDPTAGLHLTAAVYYSDYSISGHSVDPRFGFTYTPDARTVLRLSLGTTYQSPQLPELFVPTILPPAVGGYVSVGNPNLRPDGATEYGLGVSHLFLTGRKRTEISADFYRVNLRTPAATYWPPLDPSCGAASAGGDGKSCPLSYPVNAGDAIYEGMELSGERRVARFASVRVGYAVRSAYLTNVPASIQDGTLVPGEQSSGLPLQKATFSVQNAPPIGFTFGFRLVYEGRYNELSAPPFTTADASLGYRRHSFELNVTGTNLSNVYDRRFTRQGAGVPYGGLAGPLATDAYALQGTTVTVSLTQRF